MKGADVSVSCGCGTTVAAPPSVGTLPVAVDLVVYRGDDFFLDVVVSDEYGDPWAGMVDGTASSQIRTTANAVDVVATFEATIEGDVIHLHLPSGEADKLTMSSARWDVQVTDTDGVVTTVVAGAVNVTADVTRATVP